MREKTEHGFAHRTQVVIEDVQEEALEIRNVARLVKRKYLTVPLTNNLRSENEPVNDKTTGRRPISGRNKLLAARAPD
jgi:hypothetical protein